MPCLRVNKATAEVAAACWNEKRAIPAVPITTDKAPKPMVERAINLVAFGYF